LTTTTKPHQEAALWQVGYVKLTKVQPILTALDQINVEAAARETRIPPSTLRDDLNKLKKALPEMLADRKRGPKPKNRAEDSTAKRLDVEEPRVCPECGGKVTKNGTYWILNWVLMWTMGWMGVQKVLISAMQRAGIKQMLSDREPVFEANLKKVRPAKGETRAEVEEYFRDKYERLKAFLRQAIDRKECIECSL
jgi:hypothetical protein